MASINLSAKVPEGTDSVDFILGSSQFTVTRGSAYETTDPSILSDASVHPWLTVSYDAEQAAATPYVPDPNDPHQTPTSDHLSSVASTESVSAAAEALAAQQAANAASDDTPVVTPQADPAPVYVEPTPADVAVEAAEDANN